MPGTTSTALPSFPPFLMTSTTKQMRPNGRGGGWFHLVAVGDDWNILFSVIICCMTRVPCSSPTLHFVLSLFVLTNHRAVSSDHWHPPDCLLRLSEIIGPLNYASSALTLLVWWQEGRLVCRKPCTINHHRRTRPNLEWSREKYPR